MTWRVNFVRSKDVQKQLARMSLSHHALIGTIPGTPFLIQLKYCWCVYFVMEYFCQLDSLISNSVLTFDHMLWRQWVKQEQWLILHLGIPHYLFSMHLVLMCSYLLGQLKHNWAFLTTYRGLLKFLSLKPYLDITKEWFLLHDGHLRVAATLLEGSHLLNVLKQS